MSINTTAGNAVKFLGFSDPIRKEVLKAMLGAALNGKVDINAGHLCYLGLSRTEPMGNGTNINEPTDWNYARVLLSEGKVTKNGTSETSVTFSSAYLTLDGDTAKNERQDSEGHRIPTEIKFNRSTEPWMADDGENFQEYKYFFLSKNPGPLNGSSTDLGLLAWGELKEPITVKAINVVPLFEEGKFRLHFPTPTDVESIVDAAAAADAENA